jgi:(1->4)-alpha-D-glucan 1-alpha-D-glucosylmutase
MTRPKRIPPSTYRLQVHGGFTLTDARDVVPYLQRLGAGAAYTSPYFAAEPGSTHGYDVTNHNEINPEAGGDAAHTAFTDALRDAGLHHIVDIVPNHMGISTATNPWWRDVLAHGPRSEYARFFDIDWNPFKSELRRKLLLPILGDQYGKVLERGELQLEFDDCPSRAGPSTELRAGEVVLRYFDHRLPLTIGCRPTPEELRRLNGVPGQPRSFDALHDLLETQAYRLAYWRTAAHEINYRRFFDINTLAGLRVEDPVVFDAIHARLARLIAEGRVTAVRVDHPDGLFDPAKYFEMLQALGGGIWVVAEKILSGRERLPARWAVHGTTGYNFLNQVNGLFVEPSSARRMRRVHAKLTGREQSFDDLLYESKRLIMDTAMASELTVLAHMLNRISESNRRSRDFTLNSLRDALVEVVACFPIYRTYVDAQGWAPDDRAALERAIVRARRRNPAMDATIFDFFREVVLPRDPDNGATDERASAASERVGGAGAKPPHGYERRDGYPPADAQESAERLRFAMKFQQYTGPLQAKGLEDTAFYRHNVLLSLNEVGGDPSRFGVPEADFHELNRLRQQDWPYEMLATATHDTKLGEDVRARIDVLSELPDEWGREVSRWMRLAKPARTILDGEPAPDRNDEYRFYQALLGAWPPGGVSDAFVERMQAYMVKSVKEAKLHSSWINPDEGYENAVKTYVGRVLAGPEASRFLPAFTPFQERVARAGLVNSLSQVVLKIAAPGVPDFYQGTELWDFNLVDPDNRRPVDFKVRACLLDRVDRILALEGDSRAAAVASLLAHWKDGAIKLLLTAAGLRLRGTMPGVFLDGAYLPLDTDTAAVPARAVAFARLSQDAAVVAIAPYLVARFVDAERPAPVGEMWKTARVLLPTSLAGLVFRDVFTGAEVRAATSNGHAWLFVGQVLKTLPVSLLVAPSTPNTQFPTPK